MNINAAALAVTLALGSNAVAGGGADAAPRTAEVMIDAPAGLFGGLRTTSHFFHFSLRSDSGGVRAIVKRYPAGLATRMDAHDDVELPPESLAITTDAQGFNTIRFHARLPATGTWWIEMQSRAGPQQAACIPTAVADIGGRSFSPSSGYVTASVNGAAAVFDPCTYGGERVTALIVFPRP